MKARDDKNCAECGAAPEHDCPLQFLRKHCPRNFGFTPSHALQNRPERPSTEALPPLGAPSNALAPGSRNTGEIAGYRNDDAPLARDVQTRPTSQERVSNPVECTPSTTPQKRRSDDKITPMATLLRAWAHNEWSKPPSSPNRNLYLIDLLHDGADELDRAISAASALSAIGRNEIIEECAKVAMDLPLASKEERHDYRWTDTGKAMALDTASAIRALKT